MEYEQLRNSRDNETMEENCVNLPFPTTPISGISSTQFEGSSRLTLVWVVVVLRGPLTTEPEERIFLKPDRDYSILSYFFRRSRRLFYRDNLKEQHNPPQTFDI